MRALVVNFKAYESAFGEKAREIAREASRISGVRVILAPPAIIAKEIASIHDDVYLQHVDVASFAARTGSVPVEALRLEAIKGFIINHSEKKVTLREIVEVLSKARELGLEAIACADTPVEARAIATLRPTFVAIEPPELIGSGIPVSRARPEVITEALSAISPFGVPLLAGAGISSGEDARRAVELGASGVLVASAIMKAKDPARALREMAGALA